MKREVFDRDRFHLAIRKIDRLAMEIQALDQHMEELNEIRSSVYLFGPRVQESRYSKVEEVTVKRDQLLDERKLKEFELQVARFDLVSVLGNSYFSFRQQTSQMIWDHYIEGLKPEVMKKIHGSDYMNSLRNVVG